MTKANNVGVSDHTELKLPVLQKILEMHIKITKNVINSQSWTNKLYHYIETNAGRGKVELLNKEIVDGSTLLFLNAVREIQIPFRADFIELIHDNLEALKRECQPLVDRGHKIKFHLGKNEDLIPKLITKTSGKQMGLIFFDPNGVPDLETMKFFAEMRPRMEILIYLKAVSLKRVRRANKERASLLEHMQYTGKKHWLIKKPIVTDTQAQWTFLLGSNTDIFKKYEAIEFYRMDSEEAKAFFPKLNLTKQELQEKDQMRFDI